MVRDGEERTSERGIRIMGSTGTIMIWGEGGTKDIHFAGEGTWRDDGAVSDMGSLEEKEQGQEEQAKFRCEMLAERCQGNIQVEAPTWNAGEKTQGT